MIILRNKQFAASYDPDGFGGKSGRIVLVGKLFRKSVTYNKLGPWRVELTENADNELREPDHWTNADIIKIDKIIEEIKLKPYQGSLGQHPLWNFRDKDNECVIWSAEINKEDRLNYLIFKQQNYILVTNLIGHNVIDINYYQ